MLLLLASATEFEISDTANWLKNTHKPNNAWNSELLITGIGQLQTAYTLQKKIYSGRPDLIIQAGTGGAVCPGDIGNTFAIYSEQIADLGVLEKEGFTNIFDMNLAEPDQFPFTNGKLVNPCKALLDWTGLPQLNGLTVNEIKSDSSGALQRKQLPVVESMEGAALHYVCLMENIPFLQIRTVSNMLGERDKTLWKLKQAITSLNKTLVSLIQNLEHADEALFRIQPLPQ